MFAVFADSACTANIYTHEFNIAWMLKKATIPRKPFSFCKSLYPQKYTRYTMLQLHVYKLLNYYTTPPL